MTLSRQLSWSHFVAILQFKDDLQRDFYAEMCRIERWSVRTLRKKMMECFMAELPKRELLEQKFHKAVELARKRLEAKPV